MILKYKERGDCWTLIDDFESLTWHPAELIKASDKKSGFILWNRELGAEAPADIIHYSLGDMEDKPDGTLTDCIVVFGIKRSKEILRIALPYAFILNDRGETVERIS